MATASVYVDVPAHGRDVVRFLDRMDVTPLPNGKDWQLLHELRYATGTGEVIYIPAGFITDFASIPKFFRRVYQPATGKHRRGSVIHDYIYRTDSLNYTRKQADQVFLEIMELDGVSRFDRKAIYYSVRTGGSSSFIDRNTNG